ncbi:carboxymuconolactone decarboxylase family protein [Desulfovibrio inopinatus]|uniref:carboxymuconolactone decarboxylase family protein n=1 Tax=Desulfovibrio inopinatus TaxID=102109 RepID=UPI000408FDC6|nr:carboxymuconolactone decarboxylase family protein [Desulfovibrio inopinatus]
MEKKPRFFAQMQERYPQYMDALKVLGDAAKEAGPIDEKTAHLIQIAAAAVLRSEGAVHSHAKRAVKSGCTDEEIRHAIILLTPTIGYPTVAAALTWIDDILCPTP